MHNDQVSSRVIPTKIKELDVKACYWKIVEDLHDAYVDLNDLLDAGVKEEDMIKNTEEDQDLFLRTMAVLTETADI